MNDPQIDELCKIIYRNHRQALQLIFERVGSPVAGLVGEIEEKLRSQPDRWHVFNRRTNGVDFVPTAWVGMLPPIGKRKSFDGRLWLVMKIDVETRRCRLITCVWPTTDIDLRRKVIDRLTRTQSEFGFKHVKGDDVGDSWTYFGEPISQWPEGQEPDTKEVLEQVSGKLDQMWQRVQGVPAALAPIVNP